MLIVNVKNTVKKGEIIFRKGEQFDNVGIVLSGKVMMESDWYRVVRGQGSFIALNDLYCDSYGATYTAMEDSVIYIISAQSQEPLHDIASKGGDFRAIMLSSQFKFGAFLGKYRNSLIERTQRLYQTAITAYENYKLTCNKNQIQVFELAELEQLQPYDIGHDLNDDKIRMYEEAAKIPLAAHKAYFAYSEDMACIVASEIVSTINSFREECIAMAEYVKDVLETLALRPSHNLYEYCIVQAKELRKKGDVPEDLKSVLQDVIEEVHYEYIELKKHCSSLPEVNFEDMQERAGNIVSKELTESEKKDQEEREATIKRDVLSLKDSTDQIIKFTGEFPDDQIEILKNNLEVIVKASDRLSVEDDVKKAKKNLTPVVFELYLKCFKQYREKPTLAPKAVQLFLNFGMLDERLLDEQILEFLCGIRKEENEGPCNVYTLTEWLDLIYTGAREPSKSEFDENYIENLRTLKKQGDITDAQMKELADDMEKRLEYEVRNMQTCNSKTLYGQPSTYMPILYKEAIFGNLDKILVTKKKINEAVEKLLKVDYSVFFREVIYSNNELKIINETIMVNVFPDVILFPLYGLNAAMWQEVGSKNKATPARFCFPIMTNTSVDDLMVKMFGRFRWELCKCIQGMSWNDVKVKCLTSEYMDYIQFYRKNRDLTDEAKEKVKLQIQKARNNSRETFLIDYESWVKSEVNGAVKMNKVAREIVATYCPFPKETRAKLGAQKQYEVAMARGERNATKKKNEFDLKLKALQKLTEEIPKPMQDTYDYYANY